MKRKASPVSELFHVVKKVAPATPQNSQALALANLLGTRAKITYLTADGQSWVILARNWRPSPSRDQFEEEWGKHPLDFHQLKVFGRVCYEKRYSQSWGKDYKYSGNVSPSIPIPDGSFHADLIRDLNEIMSISEAHPPLNAILENWYEPEHTIGLHSDDESHLHPNMPIFSLSWGGPRRFLLRAKVKTSLVPLHEILVRDGDLLVMGGTCQKTHKHEIPKIRKKDPLSGKRISFTVRAFRD